MVNSAREFSGARDAAQECLGELGETYETMAFVASNMFPGILWYQELVTHVVDLLCSRPKANLLKTREMLPHTYEEKGGSWGQERTS